jgi:hypothetical protein
MTAFSWMPSRMWKTRLSAIPHSRYPCFMLIPRDERQKLLFDLELAMRQQEAYESDRFISRENILAVQQQMEVLKSQLEALPN